MTGVQLNTPNNKHLISIDKSMFDKVDKLLYKILSHTSRMPFYETIEITH